MKDSRKKKKRQQRKPRTFTKKASPAAKKKIVRKKEGTPRTFPSFKGFFQNVYYSFKQIKKIPLFRAEYFVMLFIFTAFLSTLILIYLVDRASQVVVTSRYPELKVYPYPKVSQQEIPVTARSYVIYEKDSRVILAAKNEHFRFSPASATKIMSALVALEYYDLNTVLQAKNIDKVEGSTMNLVENEKITVRNLLYGMMLPSGNDAAFVLAENYPGGQLNFVRRMNEKARDLKLTNTSFTDASGYDDSNFTTAVDFVRLSAYAIENPTLAQIVDTKALTVYDVTNQIPHTLENLNQLLYREGVHGIKTGFTNEAGGVLATAITLNGKTYIIVVLKSDDRFADTENLINTFVENVQFMHY